MPKGISKFESPLKKLIETHSHKSLKGFCITNVYRYEANNWIYLCFCTYSMQRVQFEVATTCRCLYQGLVNHLRSQGTETEAVRWFIELEDRTSEGKVPSAWALDVYIACA